MTRGWSPLAWLARIVGVSLTLAGALATSAAAAAPADYGDAPDGARAGYRSAPAVVGHFPSKLASNGAHHTMPGLLRLGGNFDLEADSLQVDRDKDDDGFFAELHACRVSTLTFVVNAASLPAALRSAGHTAYLNAWFDWNENGRWSGKARCGGKAVPEWRVQNHPVDMASFATNPIQTIRVPVVGGPQVLDLWIRASLTLDQKFTSPNGKGAFADGETEDYLYHAPQPSKKTKNKKKGGGGEKKPGRVIPDCFPDPALLPHGKSRAIGIFFWDPVLKQVVAPGPGTTVKLVPVFPIPGDATVAAFNFGFRVTSKLKDDRANPFEVVVVTLEVKGPGIKKADEFLLCEVDILHSLGHFTTGGQQPGGGGSGQPPVGQPPVAAFTSSPNDPPNAPKRGQTVTFDASGSTDSDGTIVSYDWDFGNGAHGTGKFPGTQYQAAGKYLVTLTVTDNNGNKTSVSHYVYVSGPGSKPATLTDIPCSSAQATSGFVDINIPSYAQNPNATLTTALSGCNGKSITNINVQFVQGPVPPENGGTTIDEWGQPKNHLHITFDLTGADTAGTGSATFTATWG